MFKRLFSLFLIAGCAQQGPGSGSLEVQGPIQGASLTEQPGPGPADPWVQPPPPGEDEGPAAVEGGAQSITFANLSMAGADVNGLIDLMFAEEPAETDFEFPEPINELNGKEISIVGYMIALDFEGEAVTHFMLVRDLAACCFGGIPRPDEWIDVHVSEPCPYWVYRPVRVRGHLSVGLEQQEDAFMTSVLQVKDGIANIEQ